VGASSGSRPARNRGAFGGPGGIGGGGVKAAIEIKWVDGEATVSAGRVAARAAEQAMSNFMSAELQIRARLRAVH
jgi:hypothetical protein